MIICILQETPHVFAGRRGSNSPLMSWTRVMGVSPSPSTLYLVLCSRGPAGAFASPVLLPNKDPNKEVGPPPGGPRRTCFTLVRTGSGPFGDFEDPLEPRQTKKKRTLLDISSHFRNTLAAWSLFLKNISFHLKSDSFCICFRGNQHFFSLNWTNFHTFLFIWDGFF